MTTRSLWIGITIQDLFVTSEGKGFLELMSTGAQIVTDDGQTLQRISSEGKTLGFGRVVLTDFTELQVETCRFEPMKSEVETALSAQGVQGTVSVHVHSIQKPEAITVN